MGALAISDLTPMAGEPCVLHARLADALGYGEARAVRRLIDRNHDEFLTHGVLRQADAKPQTQGGRPTKDYWLNEAQALLVCMFARTEAFRSARFNALVKSPATSRQPPSIVCATRRWRPIKRP